MTLLSIFSRYSELRGEIPPVWKRVYQIHANSDVCSFLLFQSRIASYVFCTYMGRTVQK